MESIRRPLQGVSQMIRFNWPLYVQALIAILVLLLLPFILSGAWQIVSLLAALSIAIAVIVSLAVSLYVYDLSSLYTLVWLHDVEIRPGEQIVNIHAGFDETSELLQKKYPQANLIACDFYDQEKHTEPSIRRARKSCAMYPNTISVLTTNLPMADGTVDKVFLIFSAHEIRDAKERQQFFQEIHRIIRQDGVIVLVEHLRDTPNFLAYNIGCLHFHSWKSWIRSIRDSRLSLIQKKKVTPFVTVAFLTKHDTAY
jgi:SAM-dependent methyltransferase